MNQTTLAGLNTLLLPLSDRNLLLPSAAIAEVIRYHDSPRRTDNNNAWLVGLIDWRGLELPLVCFEATSSECSVPPSSQMAIINATSAKAQCKFFALLLQSFPRPMRLSPSLAAAKAPLQKLELSAVLLADGAEAKIPDLPALEEQLIKIGAI